MGAGDLAQFPRLGGTSKSFEVPVAVTEPASSHWIWPALRLVGRLVLVGAVALLATYLLGVSMDLAERLPESQSSPMRNIVVLSALVVFALLIATPFVPGIEIGLALLLLHGAAIAPAVYGAALAGLIFAYLLGRYMNEGSLPRLLMDLRLQRAGRYVHRITQMSLPARERELETRMPGWLAAPFVRHRYVSLALLLNLPGNVVIGGGGGLMIMAGLSRIYRPVQTLITISIAVLPLPLMIWWFGTGMLTLPPTH